MRAMVVVHFSIRTFLENGDRVASGILKPFLVTPAAQWRGRSRKCRQAAVAFELLAFNPDFPTTGRHQT
jgi:hypothetical protein